jgi:hypothetical protein
MRKEFGMVYTLDEMVEDCRVALKTDAGAIGRHEVRKYVEKACLDKEFVSKYLGPDNVRPQTIIHQDEEPGGFYISVNVVGPKTGVPHDHGPSWAIYGIASGVNEMTDWCCLEQPVERQAGKVVKVKSYELPAGTAHLYNEGDLHSTRRTDEVRMVRVESTDFVKARRARFEVTDLLPTCKS